MVRRSKEDALATREALLDAAQAEFAVHGVAGTSLERVATAAGVTRGALYWHFRDKNDLFGALMARATLPLECLFQDDEPQQHWTLDGLRDELVDGLRHIAKDPRLQQVFMIATQKVEYVGEQEALRERHTAERATFVGRIERLLRRIAATQPLSLPASQAAIALHALMNGLVYNWTLCGHGFDLVKVGGGALAAFLAGLRADAGRVDGPSTRRSAPLARRARRPAA
ncbi:TetR family transcriptional regulator [Aquabacterium sp. J223]|uniref:TetR family transcriptional regulator n=1 Tax=Aquabacterium sp. J223 TaxID=2898431 RepID=UPI0021ADC119|nr:TetR family transcriptional regulator [Aquabacterium sp. J223]UUX97082.1 TetR family transcriptional regulator [Aquabacterium sp. J223]